MFTALLVFALSVLLYWRLVSGYSSAPPGLAVLSRGEVALIEGVAEVLFPGGAGMAVAGLDARLPHYIDRHLAALPFAKRLQIRALLMLIENITLVVPGDEPGGRGRFSGLTATSRVAILEKLANHSSSLVRMLFMALRGVLVLGYLGHPANLRTLGVAPFAIDPAVSDAELLFPRVGGLVSSVAYEVSDRTTGGESRPLDPTGPRHRAYERSSRDSR